MSDFNYQPAYGAQLNRKPRVLVAQFGDGYEQRVGDGINRDLARWSLTFNRTTSDIAAIEALLIGYGAATAFTWTPEGGSEITVVCREWSRVVTTHGAQSIIAMFEETPG